MEVHLVVQGNSADTLIPGYPLLLHYLRMRLRTHAQDERARTMVELYKLKVQGVLGGSARRFRAVRRACAAAMCVLRPKSRMFAQRLAPMAYLPP